LRRIFALATALALSLTGLIGFSATPALALAPTNGTYDCQTGVRQVSSSTPNYTVTDGVISLGTTCSGSLGFPAGVTSIGANAFKGASVTSVIIPSTISAIGNSAFQESTLASVVIPGSVASLGDCAFCLMNQLVSLEIQAGSLTDLGQYTFSTDPLLATVLLPDNIQVISTGVFRNPTDAQPFVHSPITSLRLPAHLSYIGWAAFEGLDALTSLTIPASVTGITSNAFFGATSLTDVTFEGLTAPNADPDAFSGTGTVGHTPTGHILSAATGYGPSGGNWKGLTISRAFQAGVMDDGYFDCSGTRVNTEATPGLTVEGGAVTWGADCTGTVTVPAGVTKIDDDAFNYGQARSIILPSSLRTIGNDAFRFADNLVSINIPNGVTAIGSGAFERAIALESITLPASVTSLGVGVFRQARSLTSVTILGSITEIPARTFYSDPALTSFVVPNSVTSIGEYAFANSDSFASVTLPYGITSIGDYAFTETALTAIRLPSSLNTLGVHVFDGAMYLKKVNLPYGLTSVPDGTFQGASLDSIDIPPSVTSIGDWAFCNNPLASVSIPDSVTSIGISAFNGDTLLKAIKIPEGVTSIGMYAFASTDSLLTVIFPSTLSTIGNDIFSGAASLRDVYFMGNAPATVGSQDLWSVPTTARVRVQASATGFSSDWNGITVSNFAPDGYYVCATGILSTSNAAPRYRISHGEVGSGQDCVGAVVIPEGVPSIGRGAFSGAAGVTAISIPASVDDIAQDAFLGSLSLSAINVNVSNAVYSSVNGVLFDSGQTSLIFYPAGKVDTSYAIPAGVTRLGYLAFFLAGNLQSVTFPIGFQSLSTGAFADSGLVSITVPEGVTDLPDGTFSGASFLTRVSLPTGLTTIGDSAFESATSISSISIPSSVEIIGTDAFSGDTNLATVNFAGNAPSVVGHAPFANTEAGARAMIQQSATGFGNAGSDWNGLTVTFAGVQQNQNPNQNNNQQQQQQQSPPVAATLAPVPKVEARERQKVSTNGQTLTLEGSNLDEVKSVKINGKEAKIGKKSSGELVIEVPAGTAGFPEVVITSAAGVVTMQGLIQVVAPYADKRTVTAMAPKNGQLTSASLAALKKSYQSATPANVISCSATVASNASVKDVSLARKTAKATCQAMVEFSSYINTVNVQVSKTGRAGSKLALAVTFDRTLTGK
jgi:hypothetical protein